MPTTDFYAHLRDRITLLEEKFMVDQVEEETKDPSGFIPDIERIAAFRLLAHAEFEDYLEKKAKDWISNRESLLKSNSYSIKTILDMFPISQILNKEIQVIAPFDLNKFSDHVLNVLKSTREMINDNNGIKSESFFKLSLLCGKALDEVDDTIATLLSEYGKARGEVAHVSTVRAENIQAPSVEVTKAKEVLKALKSYFDEP